MNKAFSRFGRVVSSLLLPRAQALVCERSIRLPTSRALVIAAGTIVVPAREESYAPIWLSLPLSSIQYVLGL
jgi:hypothetical protein